MKFFLLSINIFCFLINNSSALNIKARKDSNNYEFSIGLSYFNLSPKSRLKNFDYYSINENGRHYYSEYNEIFDQKRSASINLGNGTTQVYPEKIVRRNLQQLYSFSLNWQKKNSLFKIKINSLQRDFTHVSPENNGFLTVIDSYKNNSIYGNSCNIRRYNSNIVEIPITYGLGFNKKHFIGNLNIGLNNSFLTKEQTYHHRVIYDSNTYKYYDEGLRYVESDKLRFYKTNVITSIEAGFKFYNKFGVTVNGTYDFRPIWQTRKSLEIIYYTKSMYGFSIYYYL